MSRRPPPDPYREPIGVKYALRTLVVAATVAVIIAALLGAFGLLR